MKPGTERLLDDKGEEHPSSQCHPERSARIGTQSRVFTRNGTSFLVPLTMYPRDAVVSGRSLETGVKFIAIANIALALTFLVGNIMMLFLMMSYPLHDFNLMDVTIHSEDPGHVMYHFANLSKKQVVLLFTLTAMYFIMEVMIGKVLLLGAIRKSRSKCQHWLDIHKVLWLVHAITLVYNLFDLDDVTACTTVYLTGALVFFLGLSIHAVGKFTERIGSGRDFATSVFQVRGV